MKVKELILKLEGIKSYGLYAKTGEAISVELSPKDCLNYSDCEVQSAKMFIYDYNDKDLFGNTLELKGIRCCIYIDEERNNFIDFSFMNEVKPDDNLKYVHKEACDYPYIDGYSHTCMYDGEYMEAAFSFTLGKWINVRTGAVLDSEKIFFVTPEEGKVDF